MHIWDLILKCNSMWVNSIPPRLWNLCFLKIPACFPHTSPSPATPLNSRVMWNQSKKQVFVSFRLFLSTSLTALSWITAELILMRFMDMNYLLLACVLTACGFAVLYKNWLGFKFCDALASWMWEGHIRIFALPFGGFLLFLKPGVIWLKASQLLCSAKGDERQEFVAIGK